MCCGDNESQAKGKSGNPDLVAARNLVGIQLLLEAKPRSELAVYFVSSGRLDLLSEGDGVSWPTVGTIMASSSHGEYQ